MLHRLPRILRSPYEQRVTPRRRPQRQLIQRQTLPARLLDPGARRGREAQGRDADFGDGEQTGVVGDGADDNDGLVRDVGGRVGVGFCGGVGGVAGEAGEGEGGAVDAGGEEAAEDDFVEGAVGAACSFRGLVSVYVFIMVGFGGGKEAGWRDCVKGEGFDVRARKR